MPKFKISYRDGTTQMVEADKYRTTDNWVSFFDSSGGQVHSAPAADVKGVSREGVEDRTEMSFGIA